MLLVKTKLGQSKIQGIGLFADEFIPKGTVVWRYVSGFDLRFTKKEVDSFPVTARECIYHYSYLSKDTGFYVLCSDDARFYNHSQNPNTKGVDLEGTDNEVGDIAIVDINIGDEITCDYEQEFGSVEQYSKLN